MIKRTYPQSRLRRTRSKGYLRDLIAENHLSTNDLIQPIFIADQSEAKVEIPSMPGIYRHNLESLYVETEELLNKGVKAVAIFPAIDSSKKDQKGSHAFDDKNIVCMALRGLADKFPEVIKIADVALDPYTDHGHDGVLFDGKVDNDKTLKLLQDQALLLAQSGADVLAPSDMMDGRVGKIRKSLDKNGYSMTQILSYAVKYSSSFYGPFRDAVGTKGLLKGNKKNYQMDFRNSQESLREVALDIKEGADMVMVKPGLPYLDIIKLVKENFKIPVMAYQVSGEYSLLSNAINKRLIDDNVILESLIAFKRAGANAIVSYYADRINKIIK